MGNHNGAVEEDYRQKDLHDAIRIGQTRSFERQTAETNSVSMQRFDGIPV